MPPIRIPLLFAIWLSVAPALSAAPDAARLSGPDAGIATTLEVIRHTGSLDGMTLSGTEFDSLAMLYARTGHTPIWHDAMRLSGLIAQIEALVEDGLDPEDYAYRHLHRMAAHPADTPGRWACDDILATHAYLRALRHVGLGRLDPQTVEPMWRFEAPPRAIVEDRILLWAELGLDDPKRAFELARPDTPLYHNLRTALQRLRTDETAREWPYIPAGPSIRPGTVDARVLLLRQRLDVPPPDWTATEALERYDETLVAAVRAFQERHHLEIDGIVGRATLAALNVPRTARIDQIRVNLERARWLARATEPLPQFVLVDVAGAGIRFYRNGEPVWSARTQVGRPSRPTPLLQSEITHFTFNPTWTIPPTILRRDKLPEIRKDLDYLARNRIRVLDHSGNEIDPEAVDWSRPGAVLLRQDAGPDNALGQVAIRFPNPFSVYLHDTPSQRLFERDLRTVSSGCVRVERAMELVNLLIDESNGLDRNRVDAVLESGETRNLSLGRPIPVLIAYWTADANLQGEVSFRPDIYGHDDRILAALSAPDRIDSIAGPCTPAP